MVSKNLCPHEDGLHSRNFQIHILKDIPPLHKSHTLGWKHFWNYWILKTGDLKSTQNWIRFLFSKKFKNCVYFFTCILPDYMAHGLRTHGEEITFTARPKIHSHSQIFRYGQSIFCLPYRPTISGFFDFCLHWVSVVHAPDPLLTKIEIKKT